MATVFTLGKGALLSLSTDGGTTFTVVKQLKSISFAGNSAAYEDITNMDSPGAFDEYAPTTISPGTAAIQGVFADGDPGQVLLFSTHASQVLVSAKMVFAKTAGQTIAGFTRTFACYVQECNGPDAQYNKAATLAATLKMSGPVTDVAGH